MMMVQRLKDPWPDAKVYMVGPYASPDDEWVTGPGYKMLPDTVSMHDILVQAGCFPSKGESKRNWRGPSEVPWGQSEWTVGKLKKRIYIWHPSKEWTND